MLNILLENAGKRFNHDWIFRGVDYHFISGKKYAVIGNNGSGKSTLLQCIAGAQELKEGKCIYQKSNEIIKPEDHYKYITIAAPYLEVIEEMTAEEFLKFHFSFKKKREEFSLTQILQTIQLESSAQKQIRYFSSGMKQRIKLAQAIFADTPVLLLDEPCTNLDAEGYELYRNLILNYANDKLIIISSNDKNEYDFCDEILNIRNYKHHK